MKEMILIENGIGQFGVAIRKKASKENSTKLPVEQRRQIE